MTQAHHLPDALAQLHPDRWTAPFWENARQERLMVPRCGTCGAARMPPGPVCSACGPAEIAWQPCTGDAVVHTFTVARQAFHPALEASVPYVIAIVQLEDHPDIRLPTNIVEVEIEAVHVGMPVTVTWSVHPDGTVPRFRPRAAG